MDETPYRILTTADAQPDYTASRRYHPILRRMSLQLHSDRHQVVFTDNTSKTGDIITSYALHTDALNEGKIGPLERALIGLSLSSEEVALSPQLYVMNRAGETETPPTQPGNGDHVNQQRFDPRIFSEVVRVNFGSTHYQEWAKRMWKTAGSNYEHVDEEKRDIWLFTEWDIAPTVLDSFEANNHRTLFVIDVPTPTTEKEKQVLLRGLQTGLLREKRYGFDHGDYVRKIPQVIWTLPIDLCGEFEDQYDLHSGIVPFEYPDRSFLLHAPFHEWLGSLAGKFETVDEKRRREGYGMSITEYIYHRLEETVESISNRLKKTREEKQFDDQQLMNFLGLTPEELAYLEGFEAQN